VQIPPVSYTATDAGLLAWQSWGEGDVVLLDCGIGTMFSLDDIPDQPRWLAYMERLASFARVLVFDFAGTGLSDEDPDLIWSYEAGAKTLTAVLDAAGVERAVLLAAGAHTPVALQLAHDSPHRVDGMVLINATARLSETEGYPQGWPAALLDGLLAQTNPADVPAPDAPSDLDLLAPSHAGDPVFRSWWVRAARRSASPHVAQAANRMVFTADQRHLLPSISCRTAVIQRADQLPVGPVQGRYVADGIPGATYIELPGADYVPFAGDAGAILDEIQEFVTGQRYGNQVERVFAVCLFTDIVGSTELATRLGDQRWRALQQHYGEVVQRELNKFAGKLVKDTGDGSLATFSSPGAGVRCALAIRDAMPHLDLAIRAGLHAGEIELRGNDVAGINVHIAARVSSLAQPGEVLVSSTVVDLVAGSAFAFEDRGMHEMKGVTGPRQVWSVTG
jgi:class 3 adenylate cyclase